MKKARPRRVGLSRPSRTVVYVWDTAGMTSPRTEQIIYQDWEGKPLPSREGAAGGEIVTTLPDGTVEHTLFSLGPDPDNPNVRPA